MHKFTPEQLIDEFWGPPPAGGQKKLEDFRNKQIPKPERTKGERIVTAEGPEGKEIVFDMEKIKEESMEMFQGFNLNELAQGIESAEINLTPEQTDIIISKAKEGFNRFYLMPPIEIQRQYLTKIKEETEKEIPGLQEKEQYRAEPDSSGQKGIYLSDSVKKAFPDNIKTLNRPENKAYLLFIKDNKEVDEETKNKTADEMREILKQKNETGLTLAEYLIFQRDYTQRNQEHPEHQGATWLLDSEMAPFNVLKSYWHPDYRQIDVHSYPSGSQGSNHGCRSSAVLLID